MARILRDRRGKLLAVILLAAVLRAWAVFGLPADFDEPTYLQAAYDYADAFRRADLPAIVDYPGVREHPPLQRLLFALALLTRGKAATWEEALMTARAVSAMFGVLAVAALALFDPLAGGMLAIHTLAVKYTSQVYLEALPALTSLVAVLAMVRSGAAGTTRYERDGWFWLSALALGVTAAGKWTYLPVAFVIAYLCWEKRVRLRDLLLYAVLAILTFWALDPALWRQPGPRLAEMASFHLSYSQGANVTLSGYPWYQPLTWLASAPGGTWHPGVFFYYGFDGLMFLLALVGLPREWRQRRWVVVWIVTSVAVLLLWRTKWPQYTLVVTPAICIAAAGTLRGIGARLKENEEDWAWLRSLSPNLSPFFYLFLGVAAVGLLVGYALHRADQSAAQRGWSHVTEQQGSLPSNAVHDIARLADGTMLAGTERGLAIWRPGATAEDPGTWEVVRASAQGLPDDSVLALAVANDGAIWVGAADGLAKAIPGDGEMTWERITAAQTGLRSNRIVELDVSPAGEVWVGTDGGAARFDGANWEAYTSANSGLPDDYVTAIAAGEESVWFGTRAGLSRLDGATGAWQTFTPEAGGLDSIGDIALSPDGRLWVATLGDGLSVWNDGVWQRFLTSNSDLPLNNVQELFVSEQGDMWLAGAFAAQPGGIVSVLSDGKWTSHGLRHSGYSGAEPLAFGEDGFGRLWIGTRTAGIDIFAEE
jgi:sugar lactone lactonase YvrE